MEENKVQKVINIIKNMDIKDKLRLEIIIFLSACINTSYNKREMFQKMDNRLKKLIILYYEFFMNIWQYSSYVCNVKSYGIYERETK